MKPIAFYPEISKELGGDPLSAIYYQQLYYWSDKGNREDGFIYKSMKEIEEETTLTKNQQERCRNKLIELGWLKVKKLMADGANTFHYKCIKKYTVSFSENQKTFVRKPENSMSENQKTITENTNRIQQRDSSLSGRYLRSYQKTLKNVSDLEKEYPTVEDMIGKTYNCYLWYQEHNRDPGTSMVALMKTLRKWLDKEHPSSPKRPTPPSKEYKSFNPKKP